MGDAAKKVIQQLLVALTLNNPGEGEESKEEQPTEPAKAGGSPSKSVVTIKEPDDMVRLPGVYSVMYDAIKLNMYIYF